jgi:hypothetical protein
MADIDDDAFILTSDQNLFVSEFRSQLHLCETDLDKFKACVQKRNELLEKHAGVQFLVTACEHVMLSECTEYKTRKDIPRTDCDDSAEWKRFFAIADDGFQMKSKCVGVLRKVAHFWGIEVVQHYKFARKGRNYCEKLGEVTQAVRDWKQAVLVLNAAMFQRSHRGLSLKRRPIQPTINPLERSDFEWAKRNHMSELEPATIPAGFGYDKFGLLVHEKFSVSALSIPDAVTSAPSTSGISNEDVAPTQPIVDGSAEAPSPTQPTADGSDEAPSPTQPTADGSDEAPSPTQLTADGSDEAPSPTQPTADGSDEAPSPTRPTADGSDEAPSPTQPTADGSDEAPSPTQSTADGSDETTPPTPLMPNIDGAESSSAPSPRPSIASEGTSEGDDEADDGATDASSSFPTSQSEDCVSEDRDTIIPPIGQTTRVLRNRVKKQSYRNPPGYASKPKQPKIKLAKPSTRCCPAQVPFEVLLALESPFLFSASAEKVSHHMKQLCHIHLQRYAEQTSAIAFAPQHNSLKGEVVSSTGPSKATEEYGTVGRRRRTNSLPDISQHTPDAKRPRFDFPDAKRPVLDFPNTTSAGQMPVGDEAQLHDPVTDISYRNMVLGELQAQVEHLTESNTHGERTNKYLVKLLQRATPPNTDASHGMIDALFLTGDQAMAEVEFGVSNVPLLTRSQQQFQWSERNRPITELFRRMEDLDRDVCVQIPSQMLTDQSFASKSLSEVQSRFLANKASDDPWNVLDLRSPLPPSILPSFLTGVNCQVLPRIRDIILNGARAERLAASGEQWTEWRDVLEWVLLAEGGNNTAPHTDILSTWITAQEEQIGFGWMSQPTKQEESEWRANPYHYTGGRWRYVVLKPGQTVFFKSGTIHFVFRPTGKQTLALGGHILQWTGIEQWLQTAIAQAKNPSITNEDIRESASQYASALSRLVTARSKDGRTHELGGEDAARRISGLLMELQKHCRRPRRRLSHV